MTVMCPNCKVPMLKSVSKFRRNSWWHRCPNYPRCDMTANEGADGRLIDVPVDGATRQLRKDAHELMRQVFGDDRIKRNKAAAYSWLRTKVKSGHIGLSTKEELLFVIRLLKMEQRREARL